MTKFGIECAGFVRLSASAVVVASAVGLSGCVSSPTYGTGKPASEQLLEDVTGVLTVGPRERKRIDYKPRPELVTPPPQVAGLPAPQDNVVDTAVGVWPVSPEERRARLRAEATENRDNLGWRPKIKGPENAKAVSAAHHDREPDLARQEFDPDAAREEFNRRLAANRQGDPGVRRYLSEPPLEYRAPAETAPVNDIGEDEDKKEARRKANSRKKAGKRSWRDFVPWI